MIHEFVAELKKLEGKILWTVFYVPFSVEEKYGTKGRVEVKAVIDGFSFKGTLLPSRNGHYMVFNKEIKNKCKKAIGDTVQVTIEKDTEPRIVEIPSDIKEELQNYPDVFSRFKELPDYIKREEIKKILDAKKQETKERRIKKLVDKLQNNSK